MKQSLFFLSLLVTTFSFSQNQPKNILLGFNFHPVLANSYEFVSNYRINQNSVISLKGGYAGSNGLRIIRKVDDGVTNKKQSGYFVKLGLNKKLVSFFHLDGGFVLSRYKSSGIQDEKELNAEGMSYGLFVMPNLLFQYKSSPVYFNTGIQLAYMKGRSDYVSTKHHVYLAGVGGPPLLSSNILLQGYAAVLINF